VTPQECVSLHLPFRPSSLSSFHFVHMVMMADDGHPSRTHLVRLSAKTLDGLAAGSAVRGLYGVSLSIPRVLLW